MSENEDVPSEYSQLLRNWREAWDEWHKVMDRIELARSKPGGPPDEDLELAERLLERADSAFENLKEYQAYLFNRLRGSDSP